MTQGSDPPGPEIPEVEVEGGRGFSPVWLVPIIAVAVGGWLAWDAYQSRGPTITIHFPTAEWLEAGKTKVKYLDVDVGIVDSIELAPHGEQGEGVLLHCQMTANAAPRMTEGAEFWLVHPRIEAGEVSGLGTLLSGAYVAVRPGPTSGKRKRLFEGLLEPPVASEADGGIKLELHADQLYSLGIGSPIYYKQTKIGKIERHELADDGKGVILRAYFPPKHADLVRADSRFWQVGGIQISASLGKIDVSTASLVSLLTGGIALDSPRGASGPAAKDGASFWLHPTRVDVDSYPLRYGGLRVVVEAPHLGGAKVGDGVYYREMLVGQVISGEMAPDSRRLRLHLNIQQRYAPLVRSNTVFWNASGISADLGLTGLHVHAESLQALLAGGIAFATPDSPGHLVKAGSVFTLHPEMKDKWLEWDPVLWRGAPGQAPKTAEVTEGGPVARFFHHESKDEESAAADAEPHTDADHHDAHDERKHGFFHRLFKGGD